MKSVPRRNTRQGGFIPLFSIELLALLVLSASYLSVVLPIANRLQPDGSRAWGTIVFGPVAVCLPAVALYGAWRWVKGRQTYTLLNATASVLRLEVLVGLFGLGVTVWQWLA
ncbi:hypothetical protein DES53_1233 [Roseimicrobium gellanilyticum]|uniref:Uncharacterized protein n=1 Tax=Roseimicrobium gellanilyticum TaxID=748857 RepID=A0A366H0E5_9BACT|nr:hypothetical protein [Roseimicrobium gellanilyticum]RBP35307.1 hypothetical protein DES53_1233 [Roseimicrobium gellanilyticum]